MITKNFVYLSYGNDSEYNRTIFSILSLRAWCGDYLNTTRIIVYTDAPDFFKTYLGNIEVDFFFLEQLLLREMSGPDDFVHRRKVAVINLTFEKYPDVDQLFIDSDTFFIAPADGLFSELKKDESFMHLQEYRIEKAEKIFSAFNQEHFPKAFLDYISNSHFDIGGKTIHFTGKNYSWNSGVLGLSKFFYKYMPDVIKLTDSFFANSKWIISEQLAFSFILQHTTHIKPSSDFIFHYWGKRQKKLIDGLLLYHFAHSAKADSAEIRSLTICWKEEIENDLILEQIEIAKSAGSWIYAGKKIIRFVLKNGLKISLYRKLVKSLSNTKVLS